MAVDAVRPDHGDDVAARPGLISRRGFLTYLVAAPTLVVAARIDLGGTAASAAVADAPAALTSPQLPTVLDLGDVLIIAGLPTSMMISIQINPDGTALFSMPRAEVGQGLTTAIAVLIADVLGVSVDKVQVTLSDARPELVFDQLTGGSNSIRSLYTPVRTVAGAAKQRLLQTAARQWAVPVDSLSVLNGVIHGPGGRSATYGSLAVAAASPSLTQITAPPEQESPFTVVGTPTPRIDALGMVTGAQKYTLDLAVPGAMPTMVRRPPTINGTVRAVHNIAAVKAMPGVVDVAVIPTGVAVVCQTFGQAIDAVDALKVSWGPGTVDRQNDTTIRRQLVAANPPFPPPPPLVNHIDAEFDWAFASHAAMETNSAIADVRSASAEIWGGFKSPIVAQETIAQALGLPVSAVTLHVVQAGGSFGRHLFWDAAMEAALVSKAVGRPIKLMWHRTDDIRHGRVHPAAHHRLRATTLLGQVLTFQHQVSCVQTDFSHGLGEILTAEAAILPGGNLTFAQTVFLLTIVSPYNFGVTTQTLNEVPLQMHTGSFRSVYSYNTRGVEEIFVDRLAASLGQDPVAFRMSLLQNDRQRAVLNEVATVGRWGRPMRHGMAQGIGFHGEYQSYTACLVEIDATVPTAPRVTKAVIAVDVGLPINPLGLQAQMIGGLNDAISLTLRAGLHLKRGLPLEASYSEYHYARQANSPLDVQVIVMPANGQPGGAGELGLPAAVGAIGNAYARATGKAPTSFPIIFPIDFTPLPPGPIPEEPILPIP